MVKAGVLWLSLLHYLRRALCQLWYYVLHIVALSGAERARLCRVRLGCQQVTTHQGAGRRARLWRSGEPYTQRWIDISFYTIRPA